MSYAMLEGLSQRDREIAAHVEGLEQTVTERTAELVEAKQQADDANAAKISEIKKKYSSDFGQTGVFHTEADIRIVP